MDEDSDTREPKHHDHDLARKLGAALLIGLAGGAAAAQPPAPAAQPQVAIVREIETQAQSESVTEGLMRELALNATEDGVDASATAIVEAARDGEGPHAVALRQAADTDASEAAVAAVAAFGVNILGAFVEGFKQALLGDAKRMGDWVHNRVGNAVTELYRARVKPKARRWWQRRRSSAPAIEDDVRSGRVTYRAQTAATIMEVAKIAVSQQEDALRRAADETEAAVRDELLRSGLFDAEGARTVARCARREALRRAAIALDPAA